MRSDSLLKKYKKALRENQEASMKTKRKIQYNFITKLFLRIFLSSFILLMLIVANKVTMLKKNYKITELTLEKNWNFLKLVTTFNGLFGEFIVINNDKQVSMGSLYDEIVYQDNINHIYNYQFDAGYCLASGVVTKITKDKNNLYTITIQTQDDFVYEYRNLSSFDYHIYNYVEVGSILGLSQNLTDKYTYDLVIQKGDQFYEYNNITEI